MADTEARPEGGSNDLNKKLDLSLDDLISQDAPRRHHRGEGFRGREEGGHGPHRRNFQQQQHQAHPYSQRDRERERQYNRGPPHHQAPPPIGHHPHPTMHIAGHVQPHGHVPMLVPMQNGHTHAHAHAQPQYVAVQQQPVYVQPQAQAQVQVTPEERAMASVQVVCEEGGDVCVRFNNIDVMRVKKAGEVFLTSGGQRTSETLHVLSEALKPMGLKVTSRQSQNASGATEVTWNVTDGKSFLSPFTDGMEIKRVPGFNRPGAGAARASVVHQHMQQALTALRAKLQAPATHTHTHAQVQYLPATHTHTQQVYYTQAPVAQPMYVQAVPYAHAQTHTHTPQGGAVYAGPPAPQGGAQYASGGRQRNF